MVGCAELCFHAVLLRCGAASGCRAVVRRRAPAPCCSVGPAQAASDPHSQRRTRTASVGPAQPASDPHSQRQTRKATLGPAQPAPDPHRQPRAAALVSRSHRPPPPLLCPSKTHPLLLPQLWAPRSAPQQLAVMRSTSPAHPAREGTCAHARQRHRKVNTPKTCSIAVPSTPMRPSMPSKRETNNTTARNAQNRVPLQTLHTSTIQDRIANDLVHVLTIECPQVSNQS
jgi:hypothetical protein